MDEVLLSEASLSRGYWLESGIRELMNDLRIGRSTWDALGGIFFLELFYQQVIDKKYIPKNNKSITFVDPQQV